MTIEEYISLYYDNEPYWFMSEVQQPKHTDRVMNVINIKEYLSGNHAIKNRPDEVYNSRTFKTRKIVLQYVKPILNFQTSFLLKNPVTLTATNADTLNNVLDVYKKSKYNALDFRILDKMVKYGEIYEYVYIASDGSITSKLINPEDSYPVYDDQNNYIAFIEYYTIARAGISYYNVYYEDRVETYNNKGGTLTRTGVFTNISGLPIIYRIPDELDKTIGRSEIEDYIDILDNMEDLLSKYTDSFYKFLNPIPVVTGTKLNIGKNGEGAIDPATVGYALQLDDSSTFNLVNSNMDYKSLEILFKTLKQALLDVSGTPAVSLNNTDISNLSEVSIKLLFSLAEIKGTINSQYLKEGFENRWSIIKKILQLKGINIDGEIDCSFEMAIPQNEKEIIDNLKTLREIGGISLETMLSKTPYIYDVQGELNKLKAESNNESVK